jgi:dihydroneopterin aldolase
MVRFLASVTDVDEAESARRGGADLIDCKDPSQGALGALPRSLIRAIFSRVGGTHPVSATVGDLMMVPQQVVRAVADTGACGVDLVKIGFPNDPGSLQCIAALAPLARSVRLVAVLFADADPDLGYLEACAQAGFFGAMLDTVNKSGGGLLAHMEPPALQRFVARCRGLGLYAGLAGALRAGDLVQLRDLGMDYLGFRGALCEGGRGGVVTEARVRRIARLIRHTDVPAGSAGRLALDAAWASH